MKSYLLAGAVAAFVSAGCASMDEGATTNSLSKSEPQITMKDGKRHEILVGSRIARETRENAEVVKTVSPRAYQDSKMDRAGSPLDGGG